VASNLDDVTEEVGELDAPPGPVVIDVMSPEIAPSGDAFLFEDGFELGGVGDHFVFPGALTAAGDNAGLAVFVEEPGIVAVGEEVERGVEIDVFVHVVADEEAAAVCAAE